MVKSNRVVATLLAATSLIALAGCTSPPDQARELENADGILGYVPADTPYVFALAEPLPDDVLDVLEPKADEMMRGYQVFLREILRPVLTENDGDKSADEMQRMSAVADELLSLFSVQGMRDAGIDRDSRFVLFGHGLIPVARVQLGDAEKFEAAIARIEAAADVEMERADLDGNSYRHIGDDQAQIIIGVFDGDAVFTFVPAAFGDEDFRQLVGLDRPSQSIVASGELTSLVAEYGLTDNMVGLIDIVRLTSTFLDEPSGLNAVLLQDFEVQRAAMTAGACGDEIREMADIAPRMIFGYTKIDASRTDTLGVIELRNDIAAGLAGIAAPVPGMGSDPGGLISFGMSFNIEALKTFIEARLDAIEADPYECEHFQELQAGVPQARGALAQPVPEFIYGFRGFNFVLDAITGLDLGSEAPPESVDGSVVLSMEDAPTMFAMGAMMNPMLASLNLEPDGVPVELQIPQLATMAEAAYAAMTDSALAISIGADAEDRVREVLDAPVADPAPFLSASMDARWYYGLMAESMLEEENAEGENPMPAAARNALADAMMAFGDMYDRMYFDMRFTTRGLEMNSEAFLAEE